MAGTPIENEKNNGGTPMKKAVKGHMGFFAVWAIGDHGTATVVVHLFAYH
jgi:hypothetical protein